MADSLQQGKQQSSSENGNGIQNTKDEIQPVDTHDVDSNKALIKKNAQKKAQELLKSVNGVDEKAHLDSKPKRRRRRRRRSRSKQPSDVSQQLWNESKTQPQLPTEIPKGENGSLEEIASANPSVAAEMNEPVVETLQPAIDSQTGITSQLETEIPSISSDLSPSLPPPDNSGAGAEIDVSQTQVSEDIPKVESNNQPFELFSGDTQDSSQPDLHNEVQPEEGLASTDFQSPLEPQTQSLGEVQPQYSQPEVLVEPPLVETQSSEESQSKVFPDELVQPTPLQAEVPLIPLITDTQSQQDSQTEIQPQIDQANLEPTEPIEPTESAPASPLPYSFVEHSPEPYVYSYSQPQAPSVPDAAPSFQQPVVPPPLQPLEAPVAPQQYEAEYLPPQETAVPDARSYEDIAPQNPEEQVVSETVTEQSELHEQTEPKATPALPEDKKFFPKFKETLQTLAQKAAPMFWRIFHSVIARIVFVVVIIIILIALVFTQGWWKVLPWFQPPKVIMNEPEKILPEADTALPLAAREAITLFAEQRGTLSDFWPERLDVVNLFGRLEEPRAQGETGITAVTFYGGLQDEKYQVNQFVTYVKKLEMLKNLYSVDVYALLDQSSQRNSALLEYLGNLKQSRIETQKTLQAIQLNLDDLKVSLNSLGSDQTKYEKDFFTSLQNLEAEKSDALLKNFVDISQKQIALKARIGALQKLVEYYNTALKKVDVRVLAIEQNKEALVQGIKVVDVPGSDINIIVRPQN